MQTYRLMIRWLVAIVLVFTVQSGLSAARPATFPTRDPSAASEGGPIGVLGRLGGGADSLHINGDTAYVLSGSDLISLDIADPAHPRMVARSSLPATPGEAWFAGNYLFYTGSIDEDDQTRALSIVDLRDPLHPALLSRYTGFQPAGGNQFINGMYVEGHYVYLISGGNSADPPAIHVIDVADPAHPAIVGQLSLPDANSYYTLTKHGAYLYVGYGAFIPPHTSTGGVIIATVANPAAPALVGSPLGIGQVIELRIAGQRLYVQSNHVNGSESYPELTVFDIGDPAHPAELGYASAENLAPLRYNFIAAAGQYAFLLQPELARLAIVDTTTPASPTLAATIAPTATTHLLAQISGGYGYLLHETEEQGTYLQTVDLHNPAAPAQVGSLPLLPFQQAGSVVETNGTLYALTGGFYYGGHYGLTTVRSYDLRDPANPVELDSIAISGFAENMRESQGYLYIGVSWAHVTVVDARDPSNLTLVGSHEMLPDFSSPARIAGVSGRLAYIDLGRSPDKDIYIVDYAQINNPQVVNHLGGGETLVAGALLWSLSLDSQNVYYLSGRDMTNPANPGVVVDRRLSAQLSATQVPAANMAIDGAYLYITTVAGWLQIIDISDPAHPVELPLYRFSEQNGIPSAVVDHGSLYIQTHRALTVVDVAQPAHPRTVASARLSWDYAERGLDVSNGIIYLGQHQGLTVLGSRSGLISGRVRQVNGQPFAGARIHSSHADSATSDAQGAYQLTDVPGTPVRLNAALVGHTFWPAERSFTMTASLSGQDFTITPAPVSLELAPGGPTPLTLTGTQGLATTLVFTPSASTTVTLTATPLLHPAPFGQAFAGHSWTLSASPAAFASPARVSIAFSQADVRTIHTRASLALWRWSGSAWVPAADGCGATAGGVAGGTLSGTLCQGGEYAVLGPSRTLALPIIRR